MFFSLHYHTFVVGLFNGLLIDILFIFSCVQARNFRFQCGLVYVAEQGYVILFCMLCILVAMLISKIVIA